MLFYDNISGLFLSYLLSAYIYIFAYVHGCAQLWRWEKNSEMSVFSFLCVSLGIGLRSLDLAASALVC